MFFGEAQLVSALLRKLNVVVLSPLGFLGDHLFMALGIGLIASFFEDQLSAFLQFVLKGLLTGTFHFFHSVLLPLQHFLSLHELTIAILRKKGIDCVVRVDRLLTVEKATPIGCLVEGSLAAWRLLIRVNRGQHGRRA